MEPPKKIWEVGAWTHERLTRLASLLLALAHLGLGARSGIGAASLFGAAAHLALALFFALLYFEHFPARPGLLVAAADAGLGAIIGIIVLLLRGPGLPSLWLALFVAAFIAGVSAFRKLPRHERW